MLREKKKTLEEIKKFHLVPKDLITVEIKSMR